MSPKRNTGPNSLRRGRASVPNVNYFVTICIEPRETAAILPMASAIMEELHQMTSDAIWTLRCATIMPDHLHLFFRLGENLSLSRSVARLKGKTQKLLWLQKADWQQNFYDRRFRPKDSAEATIRYIWRNPYVGGLIENGSEWSWFYCCDDDWFWFKGLTYAEQPVPEWLV